MPRPPYDVTSEGIWNSRHVRMPLGPFMQAVDRDQSALTLRVDGLSYTSVEPDPASGLASARGSTYLNSIEALAVGASYTRTAV